MITAAVENRSRSRGILAVYDPTCLMLSAVAHVQSLKDQAAFPKPILFLKQGRNQLNNFTKSLHSLKSRLYIYIYIFIYDYLHINRYIYTYTHIYKLHSMENSFLLSVLGHHLTGFSERRLVGGGSWEGRERQLGAPSPCPSHRRLLQVLHSTFVAMVSVS